MKVKCRDFIEANMEMIDNYAQEAYWTEDFNSTELAAILEEYARDNSIILEDIEDFDMETELYEIYGSLEKGLS